MDDPKRSNHPLRRWLFVALFAFGLFSVYAGRTLWPVVRQHFREERKRQEIVDKMKQMSDALSKANPDGIRKAREAIEAENKGKPVP